MKKIKLKLNNPVYLGLSIIETSKTLMYEFWYNNIKPKYQKKKCKTVSYGYWKLYSSY